MLRYVLLAFIALTSLSVSASQAQTPTTDQYQIELAISEDGQLIGTPRLTVVAGQPALMTTDGPNAYALRVVLNPMTIKGNEAADLRMELRFERNGVWQDVAAPRLMGPLGNTLNYETIPSSSTEKAIRIEANTTRLAAKAAASAPARCDQARLKV